MNRKTKLIIGIIVALAIAVAGIVISVTVTASLAGRQPIIVGNAAELKDAFAESRDKTIVFADDITADGDLILGTLNDLDLNGHNLTVKGDLTVSGNGKGDYAVGKADKNSDGGVITADSITVNAAAAHIEWSADVSYSKTFSVTTSPSTFVFSGRVLNEKGETVKESDITLGGGNLVVSSASSDVTYNVLVPGGLTDARVENAMTAANVVVNIVTGSDVIVAGKTEVESESPSVAVTAEAGAEVSVSGSVASVTGASGSKVTINDGASVSGNVTAGNVVNDGIVTGDVNADDYSGSGSVGGEVSCKEDATIAASDVTATYNGKAVAVTYTTNNTDTDKTVTVTYYAGGEKLSGAPVDAGKYTAVISIAASENFNAAEKTVNITINKAAPVVTAPSAKVLTYTGGAQELVTAGSASGGTLVYSLEQNGTYGETVPAATNAGDYTVYYKVNGDRNHNDVAPRSVTVTIAKAKVAKPVMNNNSFEYNGSEQGITIAANDAYTVSGTTRATNTGEYSATVTLNANYTWSDGTETVETYKWSITEGTAVVATEEELKSALADAGYATVKLGADIAITAALDATVGDGLAPSIVITRDITIDLNGKTMSVAYDADAAYPNTILMFEIDGADVVICGNGGTLNSEAGYNNSYGINVSGGGSVTLNGGNYYGSLTAVQVQKGTLTVNDGFFDLAPLCKAAVPQYAKYVINCIDASFKDGTAKIFVNGGTFVNFDPSFEPEGSDTSYVPAGKKAVGKVVGDEVHYTVYDASADMSGVEYDIAVYTDRIADGEYSGYRKAEVATAAGLGMLGNYPEDKIHVTFASDIAFADIASFNRIVGQSGGALAVDLNRHTFTLGGDGTVIVKNGFSLAVKNGTLVANNATYIDACFNAETNSVITFENLTVTSTGSVLYPRGDAAAVNIFNCDIATTGVYVVATNAATADNYDIVITIEGSTLRTEAADGDACAVMINVAGTLNIGDTDIYGQRQGVIVRAGTATLTDTDIDVSLAYEGGANRESGDWGSGNEVAYGALVAGNEDPSAYNADVVVTVNGGSIKCGTEKEALASYVRAVYAIRLNSEIYTTSVTLTGVELVGGVVNYNDTAAINGGTGA